MAAPECQVYKDVNNSVDKAVTATVEHEDDSAADTMYRDAHRCPYHGPLLQLRPEREGVGKGVSPMERFVMKTHGSEPAVFLRSDTRQPSTQKGCTCRFVSEKSVE